MSAGKIGLVALASGLCANAALACRDLAGLTLDHVEITRAEPVAAGRFENPARARPGVAPAALPAFCLVTAVARPVPGSAIGIEIWLPESEWNGRLLAVGNGGWAGSISHRSLAAAVADGYAAASTDTGHRGANATFALGQPEKLVDFGHRAVHETAVTAKAVVAAFYGKRPEQSYFTAAPRAGARGWRRRNVTRGTSTASSPAHPRTTSRICKRRNCGSHRWDIASRAPRSRASSSPSSMKPSSQPATASTAWPTASSRIRAAAI